MAYEHIQKRLTTRYPDGEWEADHWPNAPSGEAKYAWISKAYGRVAVLADSSRTVLWQDTGKPALGWQSEPLHPKVQP